jgi:Tfp pilus assembly pilus retraction ATPase PilT
MNNVSPIKDSVTMVRNVINNGGVNRIIYALSNGQYVGSITFDGNSAEIVKNMAIDFQSFISEQMSGILHVPPGARLPGHN